ncbi:MAG: hypothetical protein GYA17_15435 [Chloroflexi bacterium]|nr:hypothetical protein [Anaerolineaceae bacterium]NMB89751.1 hypothetical protein [Chloroflexota bacterium]
MKPSNSTSVPRRSIELKLLALGLLVPGIFGWLRCQQAIGQWDWLARLAVRPGPLYLALSGAVWGALGVGAALWLWWGGRGAAWGVRAAAGLLALSYWVDRVAFYRSSSAQVSLPFSMGFTVVSLLAVLLVTGLPRQQRFFHYRLGWAAAGKVSDEEQRSGDRS